MIYKNIALVLAGGSGTRIKSVNIPKQYIPVAGKPVIIHTLEAFQHHDRIDAIAVVCAGDYSDEMHRLAEAFLIDKLRLVLTGGETRQASCYQGLNGLRTIAADDTVVLIHDAARPLVSLRTISDNIALAGIHGGVTTAVAAADTMLRSGDEATVSQILPRDGLYCVQTPQSFLYAKILSAHEAAYRDNAADFTDDCGLYIQYTGTVPAIAAGSRLNFKITSDEDLTVFRALAAIEHDSLSSRHDFPKTD